MTMAYTTEADLSLTGNWEVRGGAVPENLDPVAVLNCRPIKDIMSLPQVPRNTLFYKGVVDCGTKSALLVDTRVDLSAAGKRSADPACILFVDLNGIELGLILAAGQEA